MSLFLLGLAIILLGGLASLFGGRKSGWTSGTGGTGAFLGSILALIPVLKVFLGGPVLSLTMPWSIPYGSFSIQIDPLSALFLIPILGLSALAAVYGTEYLSAWKNSKNLGVSWFFFNLLLTAMILVVVAQNGLLFLIAWELMSVSSFFLVTFEHEKQSVHQAGLFYLIAMHIGTAFLVVFFIVLGRCAGSLDFDKITSVPSATAGLLFLLAVVGFGTKAGFMPLHVWLPYAHPAAPSHVSAVMSGVMIKTGIYGLVRTLTFLGPPPAWWGWTLIVLGAVSGVLGVLFALAQHDLKRLLAYHSVENIGIITLGIGVGLLGIHMNLPVLAVLGFAGGLFHVINHAVFKGLLFLSAGAVLHSTGTGHLDRLGGLIKRMPWTAWTFLIGSIAISGVPPLNGFVSEFLIYLGLFRNPAGSGFEMILATLLVVGGLALIGGLALACFTKAFGIVFLGLPRSSSAQQGHEIGPRMKAVMVILAALCLLLGMLSPLVIRSAQPVLIQVTQLPPVQIHQELVSASSVLTNFVIISLILFAAAGGLAILRYRLLRGRTVGQTVTWDCGYARPEARMQYTATSFAQSLTDLFALFLPTRKEQTPPAGIFPVGSAFDEHTDDSSEQYIYRPVFEGIRRILSGLQWLQHGCLQIYILYIALTLWILLIWKLM
jgi:hydrogenase-4 component B